MALARLDKTSTSGKVPTGCADEIVISDSTFRAHHRSYERNAEHPSKKRKRESRGDSSVLFGANAYKGPWARYEERRPDVAPEDANDVDAEDVEEVEEVSEYEEDALPSHSLVKPSKTGTAYGEDVTVKESSEFLGKQEFDYQGRSYMHVPQDLDLNLTGALPHYSELKNYHPKKLVHTWKHPSQGNKAHTRSITQTRFFPSSGHLLLSAGADGKVLLWDVYHDRDLLRSYTGHAKSVSDIDFTPDGTNFLSASYDRHIKAWDTETGKCTSRFNLPGTPHVLRVNPSSPTEFITGLSNKKILQFDTRVADGKPTQEYDHHLGPVNTLTFCDDSRRFISTSDDKSLRAWEYGIPVPIKFIAEPHMYPLVRASPHPSGKYVAFQSSDNQIVVYGSSDKFRQNRKKGFRGHNNAGYAIDVAISPDGGMIASGDSAGLVCFWDWKTCRMWHKIEASKEGAVVSVGWHPRESSKVVTGDVAGNLKYWD
ncbi:MAG: hypothetical protein Q9159_000472 [Coniocarpon cinnabarinum]